MEMTTKRMNILLNSPFSMSPIRGIPRGYSDGRKRTIRQKAKKFEVVGGEIFTST